jgi:hypothetical protein
MGQRQERAIGAAIVPILSGRRGGRMCCTIETVNSEGKDVAIQVLRNSINIAPYPFSEDPLSRMERNGVMQELGDPDLKLVDWDTNIYAQVGIDALDAREVAELVDLTFVKLLACDDSDYAITVSTEDLGQSGD